jgi:acyl-[acyl carrier protein]--UDP-N-acetylglucosamine O-acyltransferase
MTDFIHPTAILNPPYHFGDYIEIREFALINGTPVTFNNKERIDANKGCIIGKDVYIGPHATIMSGLEKATKIGNSVIIGQYCNVGHDCILGDNVRLIAMVLLSGFVEVGEGTTIHAGTTVRNRIKIGKNCIIGQGSNVTEDIPDNTMAYGNPCKPQKVLNNGKPDMIYRIKKKAQRMLR